MKPAESTEPIAFCVARRARDGVWDLHVSRCPHCAGSHHHGGGHDGVPDGGGRTADCSRRRGAASSYVLVIVATFDTPTRRKAAA